MIATHHQSIRSTIRTITLLAALTSLLLTMVTPFVGTASATLVPGSQFDATDATVDDTEATKLTDVCPRLNPGTDDGPENGNSTKLNVIHDDAPPTIDPDINHPGHSDLCNIWIGSEVVDGQFLLYLAWEREAPGGSSGAYWEFQQSALACTTAAADCNPFANRQAGDFIVHFDFQGNSLDDIIIREFDGNSFGAGIAPADYLPDPAGEASSSGDRLFGEAVLNLTGLNILDPNAQVCESFAGVIPGSATGNSDTSDYKDIVLTTHQPNLTNCGTVVVNKVSTTGADYGDTFPISLANDGGTIHSENLGHGGTFTQNDVFAGSDYDVSETVPANWTLDGIACQLEDGTPTGTNGTDFAVVSGETTTCTVTNSPDLPTVTLEKTVINDDGGTLDQTAFPSFLDASPLAWDTTVETTPGGHTASETPQTGYASGEWGGDCAADGSFTAVLGGDYTCTITNDDIAPTITLTKTVVNDDGGTLDQDDFPSYLDGAPLAWDTTVDILAGAHTASEDQQPGYTSDGWGGDCAADGNFTAALGTDYVCTITNDDVPAGLTIVKVVTNDDGGTLQATDFPLVYTPQGGSPVVVENDVTTSVPAGTYTIGEEQQPGYELTGIECDNGVTSEPGEDTVNVTVPNGDEVVCTITNDDIAPTITLTKTVVNDDGGTLDQDDFPSYVDGAPLAWDTTVDILAGAHTASEDQQPGYTAGDWGGDCAADGTFTAALDTDYTCTITNDDQPATVVLRKTVVNDDGGTLTQDDFPAYVDGGPVAWDDNVAIDAGAHAASEDTQPGYAAGEWGGDCAADGTFTAQLGESYECTITNDDIAPTITLTKTVVNDDGGTLDQDDFPSYLDGAPLAWDTTVDILAGAHTASEDQQPGYTAGDWGGDCAADGTFTAALDTDYTCTITNDDEPGELILTKVVVNEAGGTATEDEFVPTIDGDDGAWGSNEVDAGTYTIDERDADDSSLLEDGEYVQVSILCDGEPTNMISVPNGETRECVITNQDVPAGLTVIKQVNNNWNGTLAPESFPLTINGDTVDTGAFANFPAGDYTIAEQQQAGYELTDLSCVSDRFGDLEVTLGVSVDISVRNNEAVVCTFTNRDLPASLTVLKEVVNDDGGTATEDDFTPLVNDIASIWGSQAITIGDQTGVPAGPYTIGELLADGYMLSDIACTDETVLGDGADSVTVELGLDEAVTCTVVNDDIAPTVVLSKTVVNDDGGTLTAADFPVSFDDEEAAWGETITTTAGDHTAAEQTQPGYLAGAWGGDCAADGSLTTQVGGTYECTITNDDVPAGLTVVKQVVNDDGGTAEVGDFPLTVTPAGEEAVTVTSGVETFVAAGTYTISEEQQPGYALDSISCDNGVASTGDDVEVTVALDEAVICTVVNDDLPIGIEVIKTPDVDEITFEAGGEDEIITYLFTVTNVGQTTLTNLSLVDDVLGDIALTVDELAPGQSVLATATHVVTATDAAAGEVVNVAVVEGTSPDGRTTDDDDDAEVIVNESAVLPDVPPAPKPAPKPAPILPATGFDTIRLALYAALIAGLGVMLLLGLDERTARARHRRDG